MFREVGTPLERAVYARRQHLRLVALARFVVDDRAVCADNVAPSPMTHRHRLNFADPIRCRAVLFMQQSAMVEASFLTLARDVFEATSEGLLRISIQTEALRLSVM